MASVVDKTDVTALLPDEVLCHVFSFLALSQKLRSESVNHKFQRCIIKELEAKPQPLEVDLRQNKLNGYDVRSGRISYAVQMLAKRAKFSTIWVRIGLGILPPKEYKERVNEILSLIVSECQSLSKVTEFKTDSGSDQAVLEDFLDKCDKLSIIRFPFAVRSLNSEPSGRIHPLDLCQLFRNRTFTELQLHPYGYRHAGLINMLRVLKTNSLRKVDFHFDEVPGLNTVQFLNALHRNAGSTMEEIRLAFDEKANVQLADLFESLARFPALRKSVIWCLLWKPVNQFVPGLTALFKLSHVNIELWVDAFESLHLPGCQIVTMIGQIQRVHPGLVVDFIAEGLGLKLSVGDASVRKWLFDGAVEHCGADQCFQCQSFYPALLSFLSSRARHAVLNSIQAQHFPNWQLDRCRVGRIEDHLDAKYAEHWRVLSVEATEDQQSVTIYFEAKNKHHHLFSITTGCGRCLSNGCMKYLID